MAFNQLNGYQKSSLVKHNIKVQFQQFEDFIRIVCDRLGGGRGLAPGTFGVANGFNRGVSRRTTLSNDSEALKLTPGQPHRRISAATLTLSACPGQRFEVMGAFYER